MKIAFIVSVFPRLSETFILNQITGLLDRGHEVDIYAHSRGNDPTVHRDIIKYNLLTHTLYFDQTIPKNRFLRLIKAIGLILTHVHKKPLPVLRSLNVLKFGKEAASLNILYKIIPFLNKGTYDIIHCQFGPNGKLGALLKDTGAIKSKVITTFHGYDISNYIKQHGDDTYDYLFEKGDLFLPISKRWKDELIRLGCGEQKIVVHRMGVDTNRFVCSPRKPRGDGQVRLLTIARFVRKKGVQYGIQAVARVLKRYPEIEYRIVGDGRLRSEIQSLIETLHISNRVILLGWKQQEEIIELMKDSDILLAPSVTGENGGQEGIPVVLMEAMALGVPVISTYHSGIPELVQDGKSGFLVAERDVDGLAEKLIYLIEHQELWSEIGQAGREYVIQNYDINRLNDRLLEIYRKLTSCN